MKKLFTLSLLAVAAFGMSAETVNLWTGSCSFTGWNPIEGDTRPVLTQSQLENATMGDKLVLTISIYGDDAWREAQIYTWNGEGTGSLVMGSGEITADMTSVSFTFDEKLLDTVKTTDICIIGTGYTVTQIVLESYDGIIWQGKSECPNWTATPAVNLPGSNFAMAKLGDQLIFYVEKITEGEWAGIEVDTAGYVAGPFGTKEIADGQTEVSFDLDETLLNSLINEGINITGANFILTKIVLSSSSKINSLEDLHVNSDTSVYNLRGIKVADSIREVKTPGIYISGGKKFLVK